MKTNKNFPQKIYLKNIKLEPEPTREQMVQGFLSRKKPVS
jgi:hypothetical protein